MDAEKVKKNSYQSKPLPVNIIDMLQIIKIECSKLSVRDEKKQICGETSMQAIKKKQK
jgi:hypothetical protein